MNIDDFKYVYMWLYVYVGVINYINEVKLKVILCCI